MQKNNCITSALLALSLLMTVESTCAAAQKSNPSKNRSVLTTVLSKGIDVCLLAASVFILYETYKLTNEDDKGIGYALGAIPLVLLGLKQCSMRTLKSLASHGIDLGLMGGGIYACKKIKLISKSGSCKYNDYLVCTALSFALLYLKKTYEVQSAIKALHNDAHQPAIEGATEATV